MKFSVLKNKKWISFFERNSDSIGDLRLCFLTGKIHWEKNRVEVVEDTKVSNSFKKIRK